MTTDTSEKGLETIIMRHLTGEDGLVVMLEVAAAKTRPLGGAGYIAGSPKGFDRAHAVDVSQLFAFLRATQPEAFKKLAMVDADDPKDINRLKFLARLSSELGSKRGVIDVLRKGLDHGPVHLNLFYGTPSEGNVKAAVLHKGYNDGAGNPPNEHGLKTDYLGLLQVSVSFAVGSRVLQRFVRKSNQAI